MRFYSKHKKAIVSISSFSFVLLVMLIILLGSYYFYSDSKKESVKTLTALELENSVASFRSELVQVLTYENDSIIYVSGLDSGDIEFRLDGNVITAQNYLDNALVSVTRPMFVRFCSEYTAYPSIETEFFFNGSCVSVIS